MTYNPAIAPDPAEWLGLDEQERINLIEAYHRAERIKLPNITLHACFHAAVENQIAEELQSTVSAMDRLMKDGLPRHDALHAIGSVVADHAFKAMKSKGSINAVTSQAHLDAALDRLTAKEWKLQAGK